MQVSKRMREIIAEHTENAFLGAFMASTTVALGATLVTIGMIATTTWPLWGPAMIASRTYRDVTTPSCNR